MKTIVFNEIKSFYELNIGYNLVKSLLNRNKKAVNESSCGTVMFDARRMIVTEMF